MRKPRGASDEFREVIATLEDLGRWEVRERAAYGANVPMCATLRGSKGRVEVWGAGHAREVWYIAKDGSETLLCAHWAIRNGSLRRSVEQGCAMAGIQTQLEV